VLFRSFVLCLVRPFCLYVVLSFVHHFFLTLFISFVIALCSFVVYGCIARSSYFGRLLFRYVSISFVRDYFLQVWFRRAVISLVS